MIRTESKVVLIDAVATDKKGYVTDLKRKDFHVLEDNLEQTISSFSFEADPASQSNSQRHFIVLLFDNSSMDPLSDLPRARSAALKFIDANAGPNRMMSVVNFGGTLQVAQNFTGNVERLKSVVSGVKSQMLAPDAAETVAMPELAKAAGDFSGRSMYLALRSLAKGLSSVPGRKTLILLSAGFKLKPDEHAAELNAAIDACNRANVAIYAIDARGLVAGKAEKAQAPPPTRKREAASAFGFLGRAFERLASLTPALTAPTVPVAFGWQRGGSVGGSAAAGDWANPANQANLHLEEVPQDLLSQDVLVVLSGGTGGFVIKNTNDILGGMEKISQEQNEYYLLGYVPLESDEGCHRLRVKVDRGGVTIRSRSYYCSARQQDILVGSPLETDLQNRVTGSAAGNEPASLQASFFYTSPNMARVNLAMEMRTDKLKAEKLKGKLHAEVNVLGIATKPDGAVAARFSDVLKFDFLDSKQMEAFTSKPLNYENQFDIMAGAYTLKVAFSTGGDGFGKAEVPLSVDPYDTAQFAISGLALSRQYAPVADPRAGVAGMLLAGRTPLIAEGMRIVASSSYRFKTTDPAVVYAEVYEPLQTNPEQKGKFGVGAAIRILDRKTGQEKLDTGIVRVALPDTTGNQVVPVALKVPLASLTPGSYRIELEAGDTIGKVARRTADFEVE